jgi:hypothetical protein
MIFFLSSVLLIQDCGKNEPVITRDDVNSTKLIFEGPKMSVAMKEEEPFVLEERALVFITSNSTNMRKILLVKAYREIQKLSSRSHNIHRLHFLNN